MIDRLDWRRFRFFCFHFLISATVVGAIALWMFCVWFPEPFRSLSGGMHLFLILASVDLVLGPFATFVVSSPGKSSREWKLDVTAIAFLQLGALVYGVYTVYQARPVYMAFEVDRFRTIHAIDVPPELLPQAMAGLQSLPVMHPKLVAVRPFRNESERMDATLAALQGIHLGARPDLWMPYDLARSKILEQAMQINILLSKRPDQTLKIHAAIHQASIPESEVLYLPVAGREVFWTVLLHAHTGRPIAYLPIDPN